MPTLGSDLRNKLEKVVIEARDAAEAGARAALEALAVHHHEPYPHMKPAQRTLRNHLRARARQLGDQQDKAGRLSIIHLVGECAYEHWHRMLFARFLAENHLLIEPQEKIAISLAEAEELAKEEGVDVWVFASRCAQDMLPQIFRPDLPAPRPRPGQFCVYVLKCSDESFYIGQTDDFQRRLSEHEKGEASWTAPRLPVEPIHWETFATREQAVNREKELKTGFGRQWLKREYPKGTLAAAARQAGDPLLAVSFATEHQLRLEGLLASLPPAVFTASDALGWVYQFWQSKKKDEVNRSEVKIGADEISAVTQLFTEPYMVEFLLHNTLGAWWAGKRLTAEDAENAETEQELRSKLALPGVEWTYLRFVRGDDGKGGPWRPAAGTFDGWPKAAKDIKVLDPCCGSGHFLVAALHTIVPIRMVEEGLCAREAVDAVLRDNLHGLEIDERCCQIAAFALAFAAWTYPDTGGYRVLPELHVACTGIGPQSTEEQWLKLAEQSGIPMPTVGREAIKEGLRNLHRLFVQAPTLGSLVNPAELPADLIAADYETIQPYLTAIRSIEKADDEIRERAIAAAGMIKAADLLVGAYTLVITNVPYLGRGKQNGILKTHLEERFSMGRADLATAFVMRCLDLCAIEGSAAVVAPQNWLFLTSYTKMRESLLRNRLWRGIARLGPGAFETIGGHVVNVALIMLSATRPSTTATISGIDVSSATHPNEKASLLCGDQHADITVVPQADQLRNPDARVNFAGFTDASLLADVAHSSHGIGTFDSPRFCRNWWEMVNDPTIWTLQQSTPDSTTLFGGCHFAVRWEDGKGSLASLMADKESEGYTSGKWRAGVNEWGNQGIIVGQMNDMPCTLYMGQAFDENASVIIPEHDNDLTAMWAFCSSPEFASCVRAIDDSIKITCKTLVKVPFDPGRWQKVASENYPNGLPEPESDDPTQWLFHGHPHEATEDTMLQVAVARLLGYRWPAELDDKMRLSKRARGLVKECEGLLRFADDDGIVCIPSVRGEEPAAERLLALLAACDIEPQVDLDDWLRNEFFEEHCKLFHDRPFVWHIWDGRKRDGFHALVNYHKLCGSGILPLSSESAAGSRSHPGRKVLESLTYSYLGDWITRQKDEVKRGEGGAEDRLAAALELQKRLEAILAGEPPFDLFVRWKPLHEQPIGWEPDINDGVRLNIRPFLASDLPNGRKGGGILRYRPNIKWTKDRGKEPERPKADYPWFWGWDEKTEDFAGGKKFDGNRWNDCHYTNKTKQQAREAAEKKG
jgi:predicted GIY-YIG superfamily endonuclease